MFRLGRRPLRWLYIRVVFPKKALDLRLITILERPLSTFSAMPRFLANRPVCRSHLSEAKERSRKMVVTTQPAINRGLRPWAPISEM